MNHGLAWGFRESARLHGRTAAWAFLLGFVLVAGVVLWPAGLSGWHFGALAIGALVGALAAERRLRYRGFLQTLSGFLMGGALIEVVFTHHFEVRQGLGLALLVALLVFEIAGTSQGRRSPQLVG